MLVDVHTLVCTYPSTYISVELSLTEALNVGEELSLPLSHSLPAWPANCCVGNFSFIVDILISPPPARGVCVCVCRG